MAQKKVETKKKKVSSSATTKGKVVKKTTVPVKSASTTNSKSTKQVKSNNTTAVKTKSKEKAVKKSQQAYVNQKKKTSTQLDKTSTKNANKNLTKKKNTVKTTVKKDKVTTPIYVSPSQLEKKQIKHLPWIKIILVILMLLIIAFGLKVGIDYMKDTPATKREYGQDKLMDISLDGTNIISVGSSNLNKNDVDDPVGDYEKAKIVKMDRVGDIIFENKYHSENESVFNSVVVVSDGYLAVGSSVDEATDEVKRKVGLLVKYDFDGNVVWEKTYLSLSQTEFLEVIATADGYLVVGSSLALASEDTSKDGGALIIKYDWSGNILWQKFYGSKIDAKFSGVTIANNNIYVVGKSDKDIGVLVQYSLNGNQNFEKTYEYTADDGFTDIIDKNGYLYVVGSKKILPNTEDNSQRDTTNTDAVLIRYNYSGEIQYEKVFGGSNEEGYTSLTSYGKTLFVVGYSNSKDSGLKIFTDGKKKTGILIRYDINGGIERKLTYGGSNNDIMTSITTDNSNLYMTCFSNSKDGNIITSADNGKDVIGKVIKVDSRLRTLFYK